MKTLPPTLTYQGHHLTLIERTDRLGLWQTTRPGESTPGWIVARITPTPEATRTMPDGKAVTYSARETLPSEAEFGRSAWFFRSLSDATTAFKARSEALERRLTPKGVSGHALTLTPA
jgi:hypothetical protein